MGCNRIEEGTELNEPSQKAVTRQFLRGVPQLISSKLQLDYPDESYTNLAKQAHRIEEVLARTQSPAEQVASVKSTENDSWLDTLCSELSELKVLLQGQSVAASQDVNTVASKQPTTSSWTPPKCYTCGSTSHLQRNCDRAPPFHGRGRGKGCFYRGAFRRRTQAPICSNCGGVGHVANQCPSPHLN